MNTVQVALPRQDAAAAPPGAPARSGAVPGAGAGSRLALYLLIGGLPFSDFVQNGLVAFSAAPVMGDIGVGPEEYSLVTTLYAAIAIAVIAHHRWLLERLGGRRLGIACGLFFGAGALLCAASNDLASFIAGRALMALGCASFMTAGRVLVNRLPPSPSRFTGIRFFAAGLAWGTVVGPLVAALALTWFNWRAGFLALMVPAGLIALLSARVLDDTRPALAQRSAARPLVAFSLGGGGFLVLHSLQRYGFDGFESPARVVAGAGAGVLLLMLGIWRLAATPADGSAGQGPVIELRALLQPRYLTGLAIFTAGYIVLGGDNLVLPGLLLRAFNLPLEIAGRIIGLGALASVVTWIVLSRLLPRNQGPLRYYLAGFGALLLCGWRLSHLSELAEPLAAVLPGLWLHGAFLILVLATTAMQTFQTLPQDSRIFSHANQVKNMLAQFGIAAGFALATFCLQWRTTAHYTALGESLSRSNPVLQSSLDQLSQYFTLASGPGTAHQLALAQVARLLAGEAGFMATQDYFLWLTGFAALAVGVVALTALLTRQAAGSRPTAG